MTGEQALSDREIFKHAVQLPASQRAAYLDHACSGNTERRQEVESLLKAHDTSRSFMERPALELPAQATEFYETQIAERPGTVIGPYKLLQQIGEGGMGVVFMAEQTRPVQRTVALKIIKPGMDTRQVIARFEAERQALALMDHPNIAKVLDAGVVGPASRAGLDAMLEDANEGPARLAGPTGRPYFVMELVKGIAITKYCDEKHLPLRARLELFMQVCQAVQHAHQKGIIHRDIKPNNVLVAEYDNRAVPKVIDFGVAKATAQRLTERTMFTEFGQVLGTMEYMSPEQSKFNQLDIDTRSDIYSLGVLLYELLAGSTPFEGKRLKEAAFDEMLRIIREEEPPKPSTRLSSLSLGERAGVRESLASIAANRHTEPARLSKDVRGELDWIVMKALEKDRNRRYETASGFAADIGRHLHDEPVEAGPPSRTYRMTKFIRRNKAGVLAGSAIVAALALGLALASIGFVQAHRQTQIARAQAARSQQVAKFLEDMLQGVGPSVALGRDTTMLREIVDKTAERIQTDLKDHPDVQIELDLTLTEVYFQLQEYKKMEQTARQTLALARSHLGAESLPTANALGKLGIALCVLRSLEEAETVTRQAIAMQRKLRGNDSVEAGKALCTLGDVLRHQADRTGRPVSEGKLSEAENANQAGLAILRKRLGNDNDEVSGALYLLSMTFMAVGKEAEAENAIRESLAIRQRLHGDEYPSAQYGFMSYVLLVRGKLDEAEACARKALELQRKMGIVGKLSQVNTYYNLANILLAKGKPDEAETHFREAVRIARKEMDSDYRDLPGWLVGLAKILRTNGKLAEARPLAEEALAICERHPDQVDWWARDQALFTLQGVLTDLGDTEALGALATQLVNRAELADNPHRLATAYVEAIPLLMSSGRQEQAKDHYRKLLSLTLQNGRAANSAAWDLATAKNPAHRDSAMAVELATKAVELSRNDGYIWNTLGVAHYRAGNWQSAITALEKSMELGDGGDALDWLFLAMSHWQLGHKADARNWYDKAVEWMDKNQPKNDELLRFRAEAEELLKVTDEKPTAKPSDDVK